jgi:cytokinin riboside 5'-monophosphate phosphoribohydrolase
MSRTLCVYCSSSSAIAPEYAIAARELGAEIVARGWDLVYGGTTAGLMGILADAAIAAGGKVTGVIPGHIGDRGIAHQNLTELIVTADMRERKGIMDQRADAFLALPGGLGTLEEVFEVLTLKQLQIHSRPIVFLNTRQFYLPLRAFLEHLIVERFAKPESAGLYYFAESPQEALDHIENYEPSLAATKWL